MGTLHKDLAGDTIHALIARTYADIATRDADSAFNTTAGNVNKVVRVDSPLSFHVLTSITPAWEEFSTSGFDQFIELTDTPGAISANKVVQGNSAGTALEFGQDLRTTASVGFGSLNLNSNLDISGFIRFGSDIVLRDIAGVMTLSNIDALDAVTEATIEAAIDTLANLNITGVLTFAPADPTHAAGQLFYNSADDTFVIHNSESDIALQIGQEQWIKVRNNTGATITDGTPVYITGAIGNFPTIALADADTFATSLVLGLATHDIENNTEGFVTISGQVRGIDTSAFAAGNTLYLSSTAGTLTATRPSFPAQAVRVGIVEISNPTSGRINVHVVREWGSNLAAGSLHFAGPTGEVNEDNANLSWDDATNELRAQNLLIPGDAKISGNLTVEGTRFIANSETVMIADNHLFLNSGYTAVSAQTGGLVVNYLPTSTNDVVTVPGFTAGVPGVSNPTVGTANAAVFFLADFVQITGTPNGENDGVFEVLTHAAGLLTIRGIGTTAAVEDFTNNQFVTNSSDFGAIITKITVSVLRAGTDGKWEMANGALTGFSFVDVQGVTAMLDDLNTLGAPTADGQFIVATGAGVFAYETGSVARASIGLGLDDSPAFNSVEADGGGGGTTAAFLAKSLTPSFALEETDAAADTKVWDNVVSGGQLLFRVLEDDNSFPVTWLKVNRTAAVIDDVIFPANAPVGIGMISGVDAKLHVAKLVDGEALVLLLENMKPPEASSTNETVKLAFGFGGLNDVGAIVVGKEGDYILTADEDSFMAFFTDNGGTLTEAMRITSAGELVIGATTARARLHNVGSTLLGVRNTSAETPFSLSANVAHIVSPTNMGPATGTVETALRLFRDGTTGTKFNSTVDFQIGSWATTGINAQSQLTLRLGHLDVHIPDVDIMTWRSDGKVGIGASVVPDSLLTLDIGVVNGNINGNFGLHVKGDATGNTGWAGYELTLLNSTNNASGYIRLARTAASVFIGMQIGSDSPDGMIFLTGDGTETERMRINHLGLVSIGSIINTAKLSIDQDAAAPSTPIPVLYMNQADLSEEMIEFATTIGVGFPIEAVAAKVLTTTHFIKVTLPGSLTRYIPCGTIA